MKNSQGGQNVAQKKYLLFPRFLATPLGGLEGTNICAELLRNSARVSGVQGLVSVLLTLLMCGVFSSVKARHRSWSLCTFESRTHLPNRKIRVDPIWDLQCLCI